jgi:hypothetical protein
MKRLLRPALVTLAVVLAACVPSLSNLNPPSGTSQTAPQFASASTQAVPSSGNGANAQTELTRADGQGAVTVEVTPLNLNDPSDKLEFDVSLNTHSVDLSMDLAALATLTTDTGVTVRATLWEATPGGHHVSGKLIFPATKDGNSILDGAHKLTLTIVNVDAPSRLFEWPLK